MVELGNLAGKRGAEWIGRPQHEGLQHRIRPLLPSDDPLLAQMQGRLASGNYRFGTLIDTIVTSRQFLNRRASNSLARN